MKIVQIDIASKTYRGPWDWPEGSTLTEGIMRLEAAVAVGYKSETEAKSSPVVPESVELWKFRVACKRAGIFDSVSAWIAAQPEPPRVEIDEFWNYALEVPRDSETVEKIARALGKTDADIDALFIAANSIDIA
jgi:hypothetical protein